MAAERKGCGDCGRRLPHPEDDQGPYSWCFTCTARRLAERAEDLAIELLPNGHYEGQRWWRVGSVDGEEGQSLAVELRGAKRGRWYDFAAGQGGDMLDLAILTRCSGNRAAGLSWAHDYLRAPVRERRPTVSRPPRRDRPEDVRELVSRIWREARALQRGDPAWGYLEARGIRLDKLPPIPALRCHSGLWSTQAARPFPALISAISAPLGDAIVGLHRTYLCECDGRMDKAPIGDKHGPNHGAKRSLGEIAGNVIPLTRGAGDRPWRDPLPNSLLALAEGLEDALSIAVERPDWRVASAVALSNMLGLVLPRQIAEIVLIMQNDPPGSKAAALVPRIVRRLQKQGRKVTLLRPRDRLTKDVNDIARGRSKGRRELD
jgi:hypothetical protein